METTTADKTASRARRGVGRNALRLALVIALAGLWGSATSAQNVEPILDPAIEFEFESESNHPSLLDVVFVLDNSGSMRQNDPNFLTRTAVTNFASTLAADPNTDSQLAIVLFDGRSRLVQKLMPIAGGNARSRLAGPLSSLNFSGQRTNSPSGIERALYELRENGRDGSQKAIVFLTDGKIDTGTTETDAEASRWLREDLASQSRAEGVRIFGVAFTEAADYQLMQSLALKTDASYYRAVEAVELDSVVSDVLEQISLAQAEALAAAVVIETPTEPAAPAASPAPVERNEVAPLPPIAAAASATDSAEGRFTIWGWLPIALFLAAGALYWRSRNPAVPAETPSAARPSEPFVEVDPIAPKAQLLDVNGQLGPAGRAIELDEKRTTIGRDPHNHIVLENDAISSEHAMIDVRRGRHWIEDRRSTNGTRLAGKRLTPGEPVQLKGGDLIRFGEVDLMFVLEGYVPVGETVFLNIATTAPQGWEAHPRVSSETGALGSEPEVEPEVETPSNDDRSLPEIETPVPAIGIHHAVTANGDSQEDEQVDEIVDEESAESRALENHEVPTVFETGSHISLLPSLDDTPAENAYRTCLDYHLERVGELSPALTGFVQSAFDDEMRDALAIAAHELVDAAHAGQSIEQKTYTAFGIRYLICAVPDSMEGARTRFGHHYGGFTRLLTSALQDESFRRDRCETLAVLTFGEVADGDSEPWVSLSIVPDTEQEPRIDLLSYEFLTEEERLEIEDGSSAGATQSGQG